MKLQHGNPFRCMSWIPPTASTAYGKLLFESILMFFFYFFFFSAIFVLLLLMVVAQIKRLPDKANVLFTNRQRAMDKKKYGIPMMLSRRAWNDDGERQ